MVCDLDNITYTQLEDALIKNENVNMPNPEPLCQKSNLTIPEQNVVVDRRMENYKNIMKLQQGRVDVEDIKKEYFKTGAPAIREDAVKELSKESQDGTVFDKFTKKTKRTTRNTRRATARHTRNSKNIGHAKNYLKKQTRMLTRSMVGKY
jgi:chromatin segregation and condensation protein Rec8/ScpA/Scc1 (kleisin family)